MGQSKEQRKAIEERRRKVAAFLLKHVTQQEIANHLSVTRQTISSDVKALRKLWQKELVDDHVAVLAQELAELNDMEKQCITNFTRSREKGWISERRLIKERKAKLLGLDAPVKQANTDPDGKPIVPRIEVVWHDADVESSPSGVGGGAT